MDAPRRSWPQVDHPLFAGDEQVLFAVGLLLAAVILPLVILVLGTAHGALHPIEDEQAQPGHLLEQRVQVGRTAGRQEQLTPGAPG